MEDTDTKEKFEALEWYVLARCMLSPITLNDLFDGCKNTKWEDLSKVLKCLRIKKRLRLIKKRKDLYKTTENGRIWFMEQDDAPELSTKVEKRIEQIKCDVEEYIEMQKRTPPKPPFDPKHPYGSATERLAYRRSRGGEMPVSKALESYVQESVKPTKKRRRAKKGEQKHWYGKAREYFELKNGSFSDSELANYCGIHRSIVAKDPVVKALRKEYIDKRLFKRNPL